MVEGLDIELRMIVSHQPERRFDVHGTELVQFRGRVVDSRADHPEVVVRFAGKQQEQLYRWLAPGKHMGVHGQLEVKTWTAAGAQRIALLIDARDVHPLNPDQVDHSHEGVTTRVTTRTRTSKLAPPPKPMTKEERVERARRALEMDSG